MTFAVNIAQGGANNVSFRNRIINGAMVIDQRNAGASITPASGVFSVDRFFAVTAQSSKFSMQQNAGSVTPPTGFANYLGTTSLSAYSILTGDAFGVRQIIEGFNTADLAWGTANASAVTLSFKVYSSLTGTFGGGILNSAANRSYPFTYSVPTANTWTTISVTIPGDTSGTWLTTNGIGISLTFGLGYGASLSGTANAWNAGTAYMPTGAVSVVGTNGATFYITGVQLEAGTTASPFEYRQYGTELILCQRYLPCYNFTIANQGTYTGAAYNSAAAMFNFVFPVQTRVAATGVTITGAFNASNSAYGNAGNFSSLALFTSSIYSAALNCTGGSGLASGNATQLLSPSGNSQIQFTGCEL